MMQTFRSTNNLNFFHGQKFYKILVHSCIMFIEQGTLSCIILGMLEDISNIEFLLHFYRYYSHNNEYLEICRCYKAIYEIPYIKENPAQWIPVSFLFQNMWLIWVVPVSLLLMYIIFSSPSMWLIYFSEHVGFKENLLVSSFGTTWSNAVQPSEFHFRG